MDELVRLLKCLDPDLEVAGEKYEGERRKLIRFFERSGANSPDELADITLDRVAQKLNEGEKIANIGGYCYVVAQLVLKEHWRKPTTATSSIEDAELIKIVADDPAEDEEKELLDCLDLCLQKLPPETSDQIVEYYSADRRKRIEVRQALADRLGINREALSNRMQRLRDKLGKCVKNCCRGKVERAFKILAI